MDCRTTELLQSKGATGLSTVVGSCLSIFNRDIGAHQRIVTLFNEVFTGTSICSLDYHAAPGFFTPSWQVELNRGSGFRKAGIADWWGCRIITPNVSLNFEGEDLFEDYWISAARGESGLDRESHAMKLLECGLQQSHSDSRKYLTMMRRIKLGFMQV
jgi:hypothetical protein